MRVQAATLRRGFVLRAVTLPPFAVTPQVAHGALSHAAPNPRARFVRRASQARRQWQAPGVLAGPNRWLHPMPPGGRFGPRGCSAVCSLQDSTVKMVMNMTLIVIINIFRNNFSSFYYHYSYHYAVQWSVHGLQRRVSDGLILGLKIPSVGFT